MAKWTPEKVFPVVGPAYFGFDEPNVSENYGFAFAYKTTQPYELLAIDSENTLEYLWGLAAHREDVQTALTKCFGYDPADLKKPQIRTSDEKLDYELVDFLCENGLHGYAGDYIATAGGGQFHPECVMCVDPIHVEDPIHVKINTEYKVLKIPGLASPVEKHSKIESMLSDRKLKKTTDKSSGNDEKRKLYTVDTADRFEYLESEDSENEDPNRKKIKTANTTDNTTDTNDNLSSVGKNLFSDYGGGSRRKKRTQKKRIRRHKRTRRHNQKKNKSRK